MNKKLQTKTTEEISDELDAFENYLHMKYGAIFIDEIPKGETESAEMKRKKTWVSVDALKQLIEEKKFCIGYKKAKEKMFVIDVDELVQAERLQLPSQLGKKQDDRSEDKKGES